MTRLAGFDYPPDEYLLAIGEAAYNFATVEMSVCQYIGEKEPEFHALSYDMTALPIMQKFYEIADDDNLKHLGKVLMSLAVVRNTIFHARPYFDRDDVEYPTLIYAGKEGVHTHTIEAVRAFSSYCVPIIEYFAHWVYDTYAVAGALPFNAEEFEQNMQKLTPKWAAAAKKRHERYGH